MRYYKVTMPRGHVGIDHEAYITFYFKAKNLISAMDKAKKMGGVKHTKMPLNVTEVDESVYLANINESAYVRAFAR